MTYDPWKPTYWEPPIDPPEDPLETPTEKLTDYFCEADIRQVGEVDVEEAMHDLHILYDHDLGEPKLTQREIEDLTYYINERLKDLFEDVA